MHGDVRGEWMALAVRARGGLCLCPAGMTGSEASGGEREGWASLCTGMERQARESGTWMRSGEPAGAPRRGWGVRGGCKG